MLLSAGCDDLSGQREPVPPPPAIAAGEYSSRDHEPLWIVDLPQGGRTREATVRRCAPGCRVWRLPVRSGLNGLAIAVPADARAGAVDLAITAEGGLVRLTYAGADGAVRETAMTRADVLAPLPDKQ